MSLTASLFKRMHFKILTQQCVNCNLFRIHPNLRSVVYCSAIAAGDEAEWEFGWSQFKIASVANEANKLMFALACTNNTELLNRYVCPSCAQINGTYSDVTSQ